jgi:hypothetical protein
VLAQIEKLKSRFELSHVVFVSDRGMVATPNLAALRDKQIDWITALEAPQVKALNAAGVLRLSLFDDRNLAEIKHADPTNGSSSAVIRCWPPIVRASARLCCERPKPNYSRFANASNAERYGARPRSAWPSGRFAMSTK